MCDNCGITRKPSMDYMQIIFIVITLIMVYLSFKYNTGFLSYILSGMVIVGMILIYLEKIATPSIKKDLDEYNKIKDELKDLQDKIKLENKNIDK